MDRGAMLAQSHDLILRKLPDTTGKPLAHWFNVLKKAGVQSFFGGLELLQDRKHLPHAEASAIAYAYLNPYMVPDDLRPGKRRAADLDETLASTEQANRRLDAPARRAVKELKARRQQATRARVAKRAAAAKPAAKKAPKPAPKRAQKPARKKAAARPKAAPRRGMAVRAKSKSKPAPARSAARRQGKKR